MKPLSFLELRILSEDQQLFFCQRIPICKVLILFVLLHFQPCNSVLQNLISLCLESSTSFHVNFKLCAFLISYLIFLTVGTLWVVGTCLHRCMRYSISQLKLVIFQPIEVKTFCVDAAIHGAFVIWSAPVRENRKQERSISKSESGYRHMGFCLWSCTVIASKKIVDNRVSDSHLFCPSLSNCSRWKGTEYHQRQPPDL